MKTKSFLTFALVFSMNAFSKDGKLPSVQPPRELIDPTSEFTEGTVTKLSNAEIEIFRPWAQNAKNILNKALNDIKSMPINDKIKHLDRTTRLVVKNSRNKTYQMFMRFALNRGILLAKELETQADTREAGVKEALLNIQVRSIKVALKFYESDLAFQERVQRNEVDLTLDYASFAKEFGSNMLLATQSVLDASAQFRLMYKVLEMTNWDLSRDKNALNYAETIDEVYNKLSYMNEAPSNDDKENILSIRSLNQVVPLVLDLRLNNKGTGSLGSNQMSPTDSRAALFIQAQDKYHFLLISDSPEDCINSLKEAGVTSILSGAVAKASSQVRSVTINGNNTITSFCSRVNVQLNSLSYRNYRLNDLIYGSIEDEYDFNFKSSDSRILLKQCHDDLTGSKMTDRSIDLVKVTTYNGSESRHYNSSSYWKLPDVCVQIFTDI